MSESISTIAPYDPANPYSVLNPSAAPYVIASGDNVASVPSYEFMLLDDPSPPAEELARRQKLAGQPVVVVKVEPKKESKQEEPKKKKHFFKF
jgi:hypothetical protein